VSFFATDLHRSGGRPEEVSSHLICRSGHPVRRGIRRPPSPRGLRREIGAPRVLLPLMQAVRTRNSIRLPIRTFAARGSHQLPQQERTFWSSQAGGIVAHVPSAHRRSECFSALSSTPASWTYRSKVFAESARLRAADPRGPVLPRRRFYQAVRRTRHLASGRIRTSRCAVSSAASPADAHSRAAGREVAATQYPKCRFAKARPEPDFK
jgi:hypothetical protein